MRAKSQIITQQTRVDSDFTQIWRVGALIGATLQRWYKEQKIYSKELYDNQAGRQTANPIFSHNSKLTGIPTSSYVRD